MLCGYAAFWTRRTPQMWVRGSAGVGFEGDKSTAALEHLSNGVAADPYLEARTLVAERERAYGVVAVVVFDEVAVDAELVRCLGPQGFERRRCFGGGAISYFLQKVRRPVAIDASHPVDKIRPKRILHGWKWPTTKA